MKALSIIVLVSALFAVQLCTHAQGTTTIPSDGTWITCHAGTPTASNAPVGTVSIDVTGAKNVAIEWTFAVGGTDVTNCGVVFIPLVRADTRPTTPTTAYGFHMNRLSAGTTPVVVVTNFDVVGYSRLDLYYLTNNSATMVASNQFRYRVKKGI